MTARIHIEPPHRAELSSRDKITLLCGQLTLLRMRAELGIPVSLDSLARTEQFARSLKAVEGNF